MGGELRRRGARYRDGGYVGGRGHGGPDRPLAGARPLGPSAAGAHALDNPKLEIACIEKASGLSEDLAVAISGVLCHWGAESGEMGSAKRSRVAASALKRIDDRIAALEVIQPALEDPAARGRNLRALAELQWVRFLLLNGGCEPPEWGQEDEEDAPASAAHEGGATP